jgi:hypothetical protein
MNDTRELLRIAAAIVALFGVAPGCSSAPRADETATSSDQNLGTEDPCAPCSGSCSRCTDMPGCGWDHVHGKCRAGSVYGPNPRMPGDEGLDWISGTWSTTEDTCKVPAAKPDRHAACAATNCRECADLPDCGWYMPNSGPGRCVPGTGPAPFEYQLPFDSGLNWIYGPADCLMRDATTLLPPGPTCHGPSGSPPPPSGGGPGGSDGGASSEDYVCTVTTTDRSGATHVTQDYGCAPVADEESTTYDEQCVNGYLGQSSTSCVVSNCYPTGVPYVCPCGPSDPRSYCH